MRLLGQMLSMGIAMLVFAVMIGPVEITPAYYPQFMTSMHIGFIIFAIPRYRGNLSSPWSGERCITIGVIPPGPLIPTCSECEYIFPEIDRYGRFSVLPEDYFST